MKNSRKRDKIVIISERKAAFSCGKTIIMKKFLSIVFTLIVILCLLCSCNNKPTTGTGSSDADSSASTMSFDDIRLLLMNNYMSDNGEGRHYDYVELSRFTGEDKCEYIVCSQRLVKPSEGDEAVTLEHVAYIFVSPEAEKAYVGSYNEESGQYKFQKEIFIFNQY